MANINENYLCYTIALQSQERRDMAIGVLAGLGIEGFEETEDELIASGKANAVQQTEVEDYLNSEGLSFKLSLVENQNWNAIWESSFEPVVVGDFAVVRAGFHDPVPGVLHDIVITPKMSFGTGHHATTYLMMQLMRELNFNGKSVFDFGTGTGILAILAEKLGAQTVLAIDIDDWCVDNALENAEQNNCRHITVRQQNQPPQGPVFDVVLANINRHILLENMAAMQGITQPGGLLLLSGLLVADEASIVEAAENEGLSCFKVQKRAGWLALLLKKSFR